MKILIIGDVYGRVWRHALLKELPSLKEKYTPDLIIVNVDNITSGKWAIPEHLFTLEKAWVDIMCSGDHFFDHENDLIEYMNTSNCKLIRPANFSNVKGYPILGKGYMIIEKNWKKVAIIHLLGQVFMRHQVDNPFVTLQKILAETDFHDVENIIVDFHKEATSEIQAMARFFDGKISVLYGTHTHVQTNDDEILAGGTWYISDVWMCGARNSVIWADPESVRKRFFTGLNKWRIVQSLDENYGVHGLFVETEDTTKNTLYIEKIKIIWML
jgi:metallophosphoesterase (TIGR00282 family)